MAYSEFAYWYDSLNEAADYDAIFSAVQKELQKNGITENAIIADLGCGTGEMALRLSEGGYDVIAVDLSEDMLCVLREKIDEYDERPNILLLKQDLAKLDLYATIHAAVSTYDTFNHIPEKQLLTALGKTSLFMEQGGVLVFDVNTPYKHEFILANNCFELQGDDDLVCVWRNNWNIDEQCTKINVNMFDKETSVFSETFFEYSYDMNFWEKAMKLSGFEIIKVTDGENFGPVTDTSQRWLITAKKI